MTHQINSEIALRPLDHQVAGFFGIFLYTNKCIAKEFYEHEVSFYMRIPTVLRPFTAKFHGLANVRPHIEEGEEIKLLAVGPILEEMQENLMAKEEPMEHEDSMPLGEDAVLMENRMATNYGLGRQEKTKQRCQERGNLLFFLLSNEIADFKNPCVMDLKLGQQHFSDHEFGATKLKLIIRNQKTTSQVNGIRLSGYKLYDRHTGMYQAVLKKEARYLKWQELQGHIVRFLQAAGVKRALGLALQLRELIMILKELPTYRFYGSSLLIAFEGGADPSADGNVIVRMVDFANSTFEGFRKKEKSYVAHEGPDEETIKGLDRLYVEILQFIRKLTA